MPPTLPSCTSEQDEKQLSDCVQGNQFVNEDHSEIDNKPATDQLDHNAALPQPLIDRPYTDDDNSE